MIGTIYPANWISDLQKGGTMRVVVISAALSGACQVMHQSRKTAMLGDLKIY